MSIIQKQIFRKNAKILYSMTLHFNLIQFCLKNSAHFAQKLNLEKYESQLLFLVVQFLVNMIKRDFKIEQHLAQHFMYYLSVFQTPFSFYAVKLLPLFLVQCSPPKGWKFLSNCETLIPLILALV